VNNGAPRTQSSACCTSTVEVHEHHFATYIIALAASSTEYSSCYSCRNCRQVNDIAFDRVKYSKLFHGLLDRKLPAVFIRLLSLYIGHVACVVWNGVYSGQFPVKNGVEQGSSTQSGVILCIY